MSKYAKAKSEAALSRLDYYPHMARTSSLVTVTPAPYAGREGRILLHSLLNETMKYNGRRWVAPLASTREVYGIMLRNLRVHGFILSDGARKYIEGQVSE